MLFSLHDRGIKMTIMLWLIMLTASLLGDAPLKESLTSMTRIIPLLMIIVAGNAFGSASDPWINACDAVMRVGGVFVTAAILVTICSQAELMYFWEACFKPLELCGVSTREWALVMVIAVRFFPSILEEMERIKTAQMARGAKFSIGYSWLPDVRRFLPILIPTLTLSIYHASDLAVAMQARGYRLSGARTRFREFRLSVWDIFLAGCGLAFSVWVSVFR